MPLDQSSAMSKALADHGVLHQLVMVERARHGFETIVESPVRRDLLPEMFAFLNKVWNVSPSEHTERLTPSLSKHQ
ncbi:MAG: hypothetical protein ABS79_06750 [Planctomycetes bacterium SCN 63-9]|nr:MAG: hypothetical protein ABS79_06750 [Planctomycetes bacterium SCN 63-9]